MLNSSVIIKSAFDGIAGVIDAMASGLSEIFTTLTSVSGPQLLATAAGVTALGGALVAFGGGSALAGIGSAIGGLFGGDSITKMQKLAELANPISVLANALEKLNKNLMLLTPTLNTIDTSKISSLKDVGSIEMPTFDTSILKDIVKEIPTTVTSLLKDIGSIEMPTIVTSLLKDIGSVETQSTAPSTVRNLSEFSAKANSPILQSPSSGGELAEGNARRESMAAFKSEQFNKQLLSAVQEMSNRPVVVKIGDTEIRAFNKKMKTYNNY